MGYLMAIIMVVLKMAYSVKTKTMKLYMISFEMKYRCSSDINFVDK